MNMLEENGPPCEPAQSKTLRSRTCVFLNHCETLRLRSNFITSGQTYTPARYTGPCHVDFTSAGHVAC